MKIDNSSLNIQSKLFCDLILGFSNIIIFCVGLWWLNFDAVPDAPLSLVVYLQCLVIGTQTNLLRVSI